MAPGLGGRPAQPLGVELGAVAGGVGLDAPALRERTEVDRVVPLADVASAFEHAGSGQLRGKVVVSLAARP